MYQYPEPPRPRGRRLAPVAVTILGALLLLGVGVAVGVVQRDALGAVAAPATTAAGETRQEPPEPAPPMTIALLRGMDGATYGDRPVPVIRARHDAHETQNDAVEQALLRRWSRR